MRIGIVAQDHGEIFGVHQDYLSLIEMFGTPVILSPLDKSKFLSTYKLDGLVLPGGSDVNPRRYGALFSFMSYKPNPFLEYFDTEILPFYLSQNNFPIFGICRGLQTLNVCFGGSLYQHIRRHPGSASKEHLAHEVSAVDEKGNWGKFGVNSFHHQAIKKLSEELNAIAYSHDRYVEGIYHKSKSIAAVQWHPERIYDQFSLNVMAKLFS
jgi:putative glutamine amidotransferase